MSATDRLVTDADLGHIYAQYPLASELDALDSIVRREVVKALRGAAAEYLDLGRRFNPRTGEPECQCTQGDQDRPCYCDADEWLTERATEIESGGQS